MKRNILLCVAGLTPPIITETLYVLAIKRRIEIHEIQVITSTVGAKLVRERLFDSGHLAEFCCDYPTQTAKLRFDMDCLHILAGEEGQLPDIRTSLENEQAANQICRIVKKLTDDKTSQIYASVAGGRKTMGNYLAFAMSLFARTHDSLSHVLVDEEFERAGRPPLDFYYEPPIPRQVFDIKGIPIFTNNAQPLLTNMAKTTMAEIPFVRLRRILEENYGDGPTEYASFVQQVQDELDLLETEHVLEIFLAQNKIRIAKREIEFTPRDFWIYVIFALRRKKAETDKVAAIAYEDLTLEDFDAALR